MKERAIVSCAEVQVSVEGKAPLIMSLSDSTSGPSPSGPSLVIEDGDGKVVAMMAPGKWIAASITGAFE